MGPEEGLFEKEKERQFGYTVIFVADVNATVEFYEKAFGARRKFVTQAFGALETGSTTLAFGWDENEKEELGGAVAFRPNSADADPAGVQISFIADDVKSSYEIAIGAGATEVYPPRQMPWGQWVSRVRDCNGVLVSIVTAPRF